MSPMLRGDPSRARLVIAALCALALWSCSAGPSAFSQTAGDLGSTFSAAAVTLQFLHEGRLPRSYAVGSLINYQDAVSGVGQELPSLEGAPPPPEIDRLVKLFQSASAAIQDPCIDGDRCDWQGQVSDLQKAAETFVSASEAS